MQDQKMLVVTDDDSEALFVINISKLPTWFDAIGIQSDIDEACRLYRELGFRLEIITVKDKPKTMVRDFVSKVMRAIEKEGFEYVYCEQYATSQSAMIIYFQDMNVGDAYEIVIREDCDYLITEPGNIRTAIEKIILSVK